MYKYKTATSAILWEGGQWVISPNFDKLRYFTFIPSQISNNEILYYKLLKTCTVLTVPYLKLIN